MLDVNNYVDNQTKMADKVALFDTKQGSQNLGDSIISYYCHLALSEFLEDKAIICLPTHYLPETEQIAELSTARTRIVCGTNLITPHFEEFTNWKMPRNLSGYRNILTLGVGWGYYCDNISPVSRFVYRTILSRKGLHSVRDGYTEKKFREMGIDNVVNTGCPTMWWLTPEHCAAIPTQKSLRVITTLTDYDRDYDRDRRMIEILRGHYDQVYVWIQGMEDESYLKELIDLSTVQVIPRSLEAYNQALKMGDVDYVGTRLHAGIHAMNQGIRTLILAVDNRAIEMGRDFQLPVIKRENLEEELENMITSSWKTKVQLPMEQIEAWKNQFSGK